MKKILTIPLIAALVLLVNGCLTYHVVEYTIDYADDFDSGYFSVVYTDIRSSETEEEEKKKDFDELIALYQGDKFLLDQVEEGLYVKERQFYEKDGKLIGTYSGIFQRIKIDDNDIKTRNDERYVLLDIGPDMEIETNGKVYRSENNALLVWPVDKKKLKIKKTVKDYGNIGHSILNYYKKWKND